MYYEHDYILRLIAEMGDFLRRLLALTSELDALKEADAYLRDHCGLSLRAITELPEDTLTELMTPRQRVMAAKVLQTWAERRAAGEATELRLRALRLMLSTGRQPEYCEALGGAVRTLVRQCDEELTPEEMLSAAALLREAGRYADMDDTVFFLWDSLTAAGQAEWRERLTALYQPLLGLTAEALATGGLSPEDVTDSVGKLKAMRLGE